jgi:hypothetical protein
VSAIVELTSNEIWSQEPCWYIGEFNRSALDSQGVRRYQTITVIRNDRRVKLERDLGDARLFGEEFQLICGVPDGKGGGEALYTVEEALQMATDMNNMPPPKTEIRPKDWNKIFWDNLEEKAKWKRGASTFGPMFRKQRNA